MATRGRPRITISLEQSDIDFLEAWAAGEFIEPSQLTRAIVKKAIAARQAELAKQQQPPE